MEAGTEANTWQRAMCMIATLLFFIAALQMPKSCFMVVYDAVFL
jgi:hypothetical protein